MTTFADLQQWSAAALGASGDGLNNAIKALTEAMDDLESQGPPSDWTGAASDAAVKTHANLTASLADDIDQLQQVKVALFDAESATARLEQDLQTLLAQARFEGFGISEAGEVYDSCLAPEFPTSEEDAEAHKAERKVKQSQLADQVAKLLADAANIDAPLTAALTKIADTQADVEYDNGDTDGELPQEVIDAWATMPDWKRQATLRNLAQEYATKYGIPAPNVDFPNITDPTDANTFGQWKEWSKTLEIDSSDVSDPYIINTLIHEMRHASQNDIARDANPDILTKWLVEHGLRADPLANHPGVTKEQALTWKDNFEHYITYEKDPYGYSSQPVEVDARTTAESEVNNFTYEHLKSLYPAEPSGTPAPAPVPPKR
jgi:hypothetical protein